MSGLMDLWRLIEDIAFVARAWYCRNTTHLLNYMFHVAAHHNVMSAKPFLRPHMSPYSMVSISLPPDDMNDIPCVPFTLLPARALSERREEQEQEVEEVRRWASYFFLAKPLAIPWCLVPFTRSRRSSPYCVRAIGRRPRPSAAVAFR